MASPRLGSFCVNAAAEQLWAEDRQALSPLFGQVLESRTIPPVCDVLLIYGDIDENGRVRNSKLGLREIIRDSQAKIVVVASDNPGKNYVAAGKQTGYGLANLVMTLNRKGAALPSFLARLFSAMQRGVPMPQAWVALAPRVKGPPHADLPETIFACELGKVGLGSATRAI